MTDIKVPGYKRNRITLLLLLALFVLPVLAAALLIYTDWQPARKKNHGELISPVRTLQDFTLATLQGKPFRLAELMDKWSMLYVGKSSCDNACVQTLYSMRQARLAQGTNVNRVQYLYLLDDGKPGESLQKLLPEHEQMIIISGEQPEREKLLKQLVLMKENSLQDAAGVYLVDPDGQFAMYYKPGFQTKGMIKDLELLLKVR